MPPLLSLAGDLSKVQFPASLQTLNLSGSPGDHMNITGTFAASLDAINEPNEHKRTRTSRAGPAENLLLPHPDFCLLSTRV